MRFQAREPNPLIQVFCGSETGLLDPCGSLLSDPLVHSKPDLRVVGETVLIREDNAECRSVFNGLTCPL